jgi:hypothetical protein
MKRTLATAVAAALVSTAVAYATQSPASRPADSSTPASSSMITLTGCVARDADGKGFVLTRQAGAPGAVTSPGTSSSAGTSATGDAPSGTVTSDTPTGTTATETAVPTPPVGEPGTSANPASPTFNQGQGAAGTSGTVATADTSGAAKASASYRLRASKELDFAAHLGHTVEVRGLLSQDSRAQGGTTASASGAVPAANAPLLTVQTLTPRATTCTR